MIIHQKPWCPSTPMIWRNELGRWFWAGSRAQCKLSNNLTAILQAQSSNPAGLQDCQWHQGQLDMTSHIAWKQDCQVIPHSLVAPRGPADFNESLYILNRLIERVVCFCFVRWLLRIIQVFLFVLAWLRVEAARSAIRKLLCLYIYIYVIYIYIYIPQIEFTSIWVLAVW